jgi:hypothetical protein
VSKLQNRLSDESTCASTVLHAWNEILGLIPESEILQVFKDKCHRLQSEKGLGKGKGKAISVVESDSDASNEE